MTTEREAILQIMYEIIAIKQRQNRSTEALDSIVKEWTAPDLDVLCPKCGTIQQIKLTVYTQGVRRYMCMDDSCRHVWGEVDEE